MILPNNPAIDVDELMKRVRSDAARIRVSGAIEDRRGEPRNANEMTLARALDRHRTVSSLLNQAEKENTPRASVPRRLASIRVLKPAITFALRIFNYAFKQQREFNTSILRADREMIFMQAIIGEAVGRVSEELRSMERYRTETFRELRGSLRTVADRLAGLEHSHHFTRTSTDEALARIGALTAQLEVLSDRVGFTHARIDSSESTIHALSERVEATPTSAQIRLDIVDALRDVERRIAVGNESLLRNDALLRSELLALRRTPEPEPIASTAPQIAQSPASDALHAAIGDMFRGDRDVISQRLAVYISLIMEAGTVGAEHPLLDIGSGRGEWLSVLRDNGIAAHGSDSNGLLVNEAVTAGLDVVHQDGLETLRNSATASLGAVTAFHVVEHLTFDELCTLLAEAQRALTPGGLLILETPDPRNVVVSTRTFYLDPTHRHPIPSELLEFLVASFGYAHIRQRELHAPETKLFSEDDAIGRTLNALFSRAQDYAIVASSP